MDEEERGWGRVAWEEEHNEENEVNHDGEPEPEEPAENVEEILKECVEKFSSKDYIMEPGIFGQLQRYFQAGGSPEQVITLLSKNYNAYAQMANLMMEWLIIIKGANINEVRSMVESSLRDMIIKTFDPKKADTIFTEEGETPSWLTEMIEHSTWRALIYKLAEEYPDCLMLNFTIKLISDAGYQGEITSISTAAQQIEVFSRMLKTSICKIISSSEDQMLKNMQETAKMICHSEHTFVYSQVLLQVLMQEAKGSHQMSSLMKRLSQEIVKCAHDSNHDVTPLVMSLNGSTNYPRACLALGAMLSRNALNPADITVLYKMFSTSDPPPVDLIRVPQFLELLIDSLFKTGSKLNPEHKSKYIFLLAYAASVCDVFRRSHRYSLKQEELKSTIQAVEKVHTICSTENKGTGELIGELPSLYQCIRVPVVSVGLIRWIQFTVTEPSYFKLCTEHTPLHLAILDEIVSCHPLLHQKVLDLLILLFESKQDELDILVLLELRKVLLDRMVFLLCKGHVIQVVKYIKQCWAKGDTDISLIRYFVKEVLDLISPPYSLEFVQLFLPMVESDEITGSMRGDTGDAGDSISEFIVYCKAHYSSL